MKQAAIVWVSLGIGVYLGRLQVKPPLQITYEQPSVPQYRSLFSEDHTPGSPNDIRRAVMEDRNK